MATEKTQLLSLRVPRRVSARLVAISRRRGTTVSAVVREALETLADGGTASAWDLGAHVFGKADRRLPKDLSTNRAYLRGFGK